MLTTLNSQTFNRLCRMFRTCHALGKHARPYTDFVWACDVDKRKGLDVGTSYRNDKQARIFTHHIAVNAQGIFAAISTAMTRRGVAETEWQEKLVGFGSDGASVMVGRNNGVIALLRQLQPAVQGVHCAVQGVHCAAHQMELAYKVNI